MQTSDHREEDACLAALLSLVRTDLSRREDAVRRIVETAARTLQLDRVGLWFYNDDKSAIVVEDLYLLGEDVHQAGHSLTAGEYPSYFAALAESRAIAADDAKQDPRTREFKRTYLDPLHVSSMLDVPVRCEGKLVGVLCHERVGSPRIWNPAEKEFCASLADLVGTVIEASRRRSSEEQLRELAASLERRVVERTRELEESNLALTRTVSDLEAFCYSVSHDLRGPLRVINGFASMLESSALERGSADDSDIATRIRDNSHRMAELLDGLLAFFRLGRRPLESQRVDMDALLRTTISTLGLDLGRTSLKARPLAPATGDPVLLGDVLANLLTNAVKFSSRRESSRVEIDCEVSASEVVYRVADNGVGFTAEQSTKLFEPFQRLHAAEGFEGTGVGLAIVRRIVERHGGRVWAEAMPGEGATFRFALPRG
jgi:signal transduction histidine kinase